MDFYLIIDSTIRILEIVVWPLIVLILAWIARKPILSLLPFIENIKFRGAEISFFAKSLNQIKYEMLEDPNVEIHTATTNTGIDHSLKLSPDDIIVVETWNALELSARTKVESLLPSNESFKNPLERPIDYLEFKGALRRTTANAIRKLQALRNQVAHHGIHAVSKEDATQYAKLAAGIINTIDNIVDLPTVKLTALTLLILEINQLIDSGNFNNLKVDEVYDWIKKENIIPSLANLAKNHIDLSPYGSNGPYRNFAQYYHEQMKNLYDGYAGDHARKWGVENLGLCLLLAWTNQLIQQGSGWYPDEI